MEGLLLVWHSCGLWEFSSEWDVNYALELCPLESFSLMGRNTREWMKV